MRKFLLSVLLLPTAVYADPVTIDKSVVCDKAENVVKSLTEKYGENPIWIGNSEDSKISLLVNPKTNSWSIIQFNKTLACLLESGEGFQLKKNIFSRTDV